MEKIDLRELNKMTKTFRGCHRALLKLKAGVTFDVVFWSGYNRSYTSLPIIDFPSTRDYFARSLEAEMDKLRKKFTAMGVDPLDIDRRKTKKAELKAVAK
jgi:hypothetical protein